MAKEDYVAGICEEYKEKVLDAALQAPTGDNAQFWKMSFDGAVLKINYDHKLATHVLDDNYCASLLSLGAVVESVNIISAKLGITSIVQYSLSDKKSTLWAKIFFKASETSTKEDLSEALYARETNRHNYKKVGVPSGFFNGLKSYASELGVKISEESKITKNMFWFLHLCEHYIWYNRSVFMDTTDWIRFSEKERVESKDGFGLKNLKLNFFDGLFVKVFRKSELLFKIIWTLGMKFRIWLDSYIAIKNTGSFVVFSSKGKEDIDIVNVGRVMFKTWVSLQSINYGVQPLTTASLLPFNLKKSGELRDCPDNFLNEFRKSDEYFKESFSLENDDKVVWMLRTGPAKPLANDARTLRRTRVK